MKYGIAFNTKKKPGKIEVLFVELSTGWMKGSDKVSVALKDHPRYMELEEYVLSNLRADAQKKDS